MNHAMLTFDLEEFDLAMDFNQNIEKNEIFEISYNGLKGVIDILDEYGVKSTFFTTAVFGEKYQEILKILVRKKHEIALHGYEHKQNYQKMSMEKACDFLKKGKNILENTTGENIVGYRSPRMALIDFKILKKIGIKYDSSLNPTFIPGRYNNLNKPRKMFKKDGIIEVPTSVVPIIRFPFSFVFFRILGLNYAKLCTKLTFLDSNFVNIYFHPWEFNDMKKYNLPTIYSKKTGGEMIGLFKKYLSWCRYNDFKFETIREFLKIN